MVAYIIRRTLYAIPVLIGVNVITFMLFFFVNSPEDIAKRHLGKRFTPESIEKYIREHNLDLPQFYNAGWRRYQTSSSKGPLGNTQKFRFPTNGKGEYRLVIETPVGKDEAAVRKLSIRSVIPAPPPPPPPAPKEGEPPPAPPKEADPTPSGTLSLPGEFSGDSITLPAVLGTRTYDFSYDPGTVTEGHEPVFQVEFIVGDNAAAPPPLDPKAAPDAKPKKPATISPFHRVGMEFKRDIPFTEKFTQTLFWQHSVNTLIFKYGKTVNGNNIWDELIERAGPSLTIAIPVFSLSLFFTILFGMMIAFHRGTYLDRYVVVVCIVMMSISGMFYIIGFQILMGKLLRLGPISGYEYGSFPLKYVLLPIFISVFSGLWGGIRLYRILFLEEVHRDYIRTARAKGLSETRIMFTHALKNAMLPILTMVVVEIPSLYSGSLVMESYFAIPGMGSFTLNAIQSVDFATVQACVCLGSFIYVVSLILTDISYTLADPRVRLQ